MCLQPLRVPHEDHLRRGLVSAATAAASPRLHPCPCATVTPTLPRRCHLTGALATACGDDAIRVFEEGTGQEPSFSLAAHVPRAHAQDVNCVAWSPVEPGLLASCGDDGDIAFWRYQRPEGC